MSRIYSGSRRGYIYAASYKRIRVMYLLPLILGIIFGCISITLLIIGISMLATGSDMFDAIVFIGPGGILFLAFLGFGGMGLSVYLPARDVIKAYNNNNIKYLIEIFTTQQVTNIRESSRFGLAYYALMDKDPQFLANHISKRIEEFRNSPFIDYQALNQMLYVLAVKLGYNHSGEMLSDLKGEKIKKEIIKEETIEDVDLRIPITKVYFIEYLPSDTKCMISGLQLDIEINTIVACPNCGNMAERKQLNSWLKKSKKCPVCKKSFSIEDFPLVKLDD
ncbi:MAG: hypothetical protein FK733_12270 [Asgard group archaeon]|nr:hypothetical protein [Asgard group archaeon]